MIKRRLQGAAPALLLALALTAGGVKAQERLSNITTPREELGFDIGDDYHLANYQQLVTYWQKLAAESDRMVLDTIGTTEEGRPQLMAIISSPENIRDREQYRQISARLAQVKGVGDRDEATRLAREGKAIVWIDGGLHASEVLGAQQLMQLVYDMVSKTDPETMRFLNDDILLAVHCNPDGQDLLADWYNRNPTLTERSTSNVPVLYEKYAGHDNNRDFFMTNLAETRNMAKVLFHEWFPQIVYNHHQTGPAGAVMFSPPFRDPPNYNFHPLVLTETEEIGGAMHSRFISESKPGVTDRSGATYSTWWNGGLRTTPYFHNEIGLLTETIGNPTPQEIPFVPEKALEQNDLPLPIEPTTTWHFKQSIDYEQTANRAVLDYASRNRERLLENIWVMGHDNVVRGSEDTWSNRPDELDAAAKEVGRRGTPAQYQTLLRKPSDREPRGYIVPADQPDEPTVVKFINTFLRNGVTVERATAAFTVNGKRYPAGSFVLRTDQPFAPEVFDMFEPQDHPNDFAYPGGPPIPPYDLTGWTLAYQMGIDFDRILDDFSGPFQTLDSWEIAPRPGTVSGPANAAGWLLDHRVNDAFNVANKLLNAGKRVEWIQGPFTAGGTSYPGGAFFVASGRGVQDQLQDLARSLGVDAQGVASRPSGQSLRLKPIKVALLDRYGGSSPSGWTRYVLEHFGIDYTLVYPPDVDAGKLSNYDVLIVPDGLVGGRRFGNRDDEALKASIPEKYRGWVGEISQETSIPQIKSFLEKGGTVVAEGGSTELGTLLGLPLQSQLMDAQGKPISREDYFIPGALLNVDVAAGSSPVVQGLGGAITVQYDNNPVYAPAPGATGIQVLGRYATPAPLESGWAWGQEHIAGKPALLQADVGKGKLFLYGTDITFRGQPHEDFPLLFNALFWGPAASR